MTLTRKHPLRRTGPLRKVSPKQAKATRAKCKVYNSMSKDECFTCGPDCRAYELTPSHILTQGNHGLHKANPTNIVWECWGMHQLWEHQKTVYARRFPEAFVEKIKRMRKIDPSAYAAFRMKHPHLFDAT